MKPLITVITATTGNIYATSGTMYSQHANVTGNIYATTGTMYGQHANVTGNIYANTGVVFSNIANIANGIGNLAGGIGSAIPSLSGITGAIGSIAGGVGQVSSMLSAYKIGGTVNGGVTYVPTKSSFTVTVRPVYSRTSIRQFSLDQFVSGGDVWTIVDD